MVGIDMEMPASCRECKLKMVAYCGMAVIMELSQDKLRIGETKPDWCPLIDLERNEEKEDEA